MHCYARKSTRMASELISLCKPKKAKHLGHHSWAWPCFLHCWALPLPKASPSGLHSTTKSFQTSISHQGPLSHHPTGEKRFLSCVMECQAPTTKSIDMEHLVRRAKEKFLYPFRKCSISCIHLLCPLPFASNKATNFATETAAKCCGSRVQTPRL